MTDLQQIQAPIATELARFNELLEATLQHDNPLLHTALVHILRRKGKQMRPTMVLLAARAAGEVTPEVYHAALSLELLHTASLVHDDVVDESDRRRGQESVNALLDNQAAVLVGDYILSKSLQHAAATQDPRVVRVVAELGQTLADGELLQMHGSDATDVNEALYYEIIRKKTASLFSACESPAAGEPPCREEHPPRPTPARTASASAAEATAAAVARATVPERVTSVRSMTGRTFMMTLPSRFEPSRRARRRRTTSATVGTTRPRACGRRFGTCS